MPLANPHISSLAHSFQTTAPSIQYYVPVRTYVHLLELVRQHRARRDATRPFVLHSFHSSLHLIANIKTSCHSYPTSTITSQRLNVEQEHQRNSKG